MTDMHSVHVAPVRPANVLLWSASVHIVFHESSATVLVSVLLKSVLYVWSFLCTVCVFMGKMLTNLNVFF